jgi:hypothetical protein
MTDVVTDPPRVMYDGGRQTMLARKRPATTSRTLGGLLRVPTC